MHFPHSLSMYAPHQKNAHSCVFIYLLARSISIKHLLLLLRLVIIRSPLRLLTQFGVLSLSLLLAREEYRFMLLLFIYLKKCEKRVEIEIVLV